MATGKEYYRNLAEAERMSDIEVYAQIFTAAAQECCLSCGGPDWIAHLHFDDGLIVFVEVDGGVPTPVWHTLNDPLNVACESWQQFLSNR